MTRPVNVQRCADINLSALSSLLGEYGLNVELLPVEADIPGSYWGAPEAGLVKNTLYIRPDTPTHSALHEAGHWICMDDARRANLHTDAGGTVLEECAVNYLQILLAEALPDVGRAQMLADMTAWGYNYREGSVYAWLEGDAIDAIRWLQEHRLIDAARQRITQP
ncbi:hypothetical protein [uncultured Cardiobacterium sp.]|uniref:hypothetical protein n=1 Tax=uncultured Cardiobacterium sp. TaxID=417619 RepID=UPI00261F3090|nr:hypothetical protein [uncultured Cardiobacterium sp.]